MMNFAIIGPGNIAHKFAKAVKKCDNVQIYAVASHSEERAKKFADEFGIPQYFSDYESVYNNSDIDAVYISVPHVFHPEIAKKCIQSGKAVLSEKPFAISEKEAVETVELAKQKNVLFMEAMWTRFLPTMNCARNWIKEGKIGDIQQISADFSFRCARNPEGRLLNKSLGGGALLDVGVYCLDFLLDFAGAEVKDYKGFSAIGDTGVDENSSCSLIFKNDVVANFMCGFRARSSNYGIITGNKGYIILPHFWESQTCMLYNNNDEVLENFVEKEENGFVYEIRHFAQLFIDNKKQSPLMTYNDTVVSAKILEDLRK